MSNIHILVLEPPSLSQRIQRASQTNETSLKVVGVAAGPDEALDLLQNHQIEVLVIDLAEISPAGLEILQDLRAQTAHVIVLARTNNTDEGFILRAIQAGVMGFIGIDADQDEIVTAIQTVRDGKAYLPPAVTQQFVSDIQQAYRECLSANPKR